MKKAILLFIFIAIPVMAFAQLQVGIVGMYDSSWENLNQGAFTTEDFTYGLESRLTLGIFQGGFTALYVPGQYPEWDATLMMADIGLSANLLFLRLGIGAGPTYFMYFDPTINPDGSAIPWGVNLKASADIEFGDISLGLIGFYSFNDFEELLAADYSSVVPYVGISLLFKLF